MWDLPQHNLEVQQRAVNTCILSNQVEYLDSTYNIMLILDNTENIIQENNVPSKAVEIGDYYAADWKSPLLTMQISMITTAYWFPLLLIDLAIIPCILVMYIIRFIYKVIILFTNAFVHNCLHNFCFLSYLPQFSYFKWNDYAYFILFST